MTGRRQMRLTLLALLICLLGIGTVGCRNLYRETRSLYPAASCDRFKLRIEEARQAALQAGQAHSRIHTGTEKGLDERPTRLDQNRFEKAALDFRRRVAAARDIAADCEDPGELQAELEQLEQQSDMLMESVRLLTDDIDAWQQ